MVNFRQTAHKMLAVVDADNPSHVLGDLDTSEGLDQYRFYSCAVCTADELRQIADKLDALNTDGS